LPKCCNSPSHRNEFSIILILVLGVIPKANTTIEDGDEKDFSSGALLHDDASFPLTPALSLGERENRFQRFGKTTGGFHLLESEFYKGVQRLFPEGEGQGEGKRTAQKYDSRIDDCPCRAGFVFGRRRESSRDE
jgi:hypothetical protein